MVNKRKISISIISLALAFMVTLGLITSFSHKITTVSAETTSELNVNAKSALLMDSASGKIVFEQNTIEHLPIASMVKIMTLLLTFEEIERGNITLDTDIIASSNATSMGGSQAFLDTNSPYKLNELIKSIVVGSANDSCVAVAEHISGSVESFVDKMNSKAKELSMKDTNFVNCTGLPAPNQYSCANDVALMTKEMISHKDFYNYSTIWMFDFKHPSGRFTSLSNTNKLLKGYEGCDGGKTGFTNEAMFCLSATAKRGDMRLISVVMGAETSKIRNGENAKLFNYGFANYETKHLVVKSVGNNENYEVANSIEKTVKLAPSEDFYYFGKKNSGGEISYDIIVNKLSAPFESGTTVGKLIVKMGGQEIGSVPLVTVTGTTKISYLDILNEMIKKW